MELIYWLLAVLALLLCLYLYGTWNYDYFSKQNVPGPPTLPILGNMGRAMLFKEHFAYSMRDNYQKYKNHGLYGVFQFTKPMLMVCDPDMIKLITVKDSEYFIDHTSVVTEELEPLIGKSLIALEGQRWKDMRSTLSPAFTTSKIKAMFVLVKRCGEQMADYLEKKCGENEDGIESLELKEFFTRYTNDVIATSAFGVHVDSLAQPDNEFYKMGSVASKISKARLFVFFGFMAFPKLMKMLDISMFPKVTKNFFRTLIHDTLEVREREGIIRPDMIHLLMQARKGTLKHDDVTEMEDEGKGNRRAELSEDDITGNALLFFMAGFDTTSTLLCFMGLLLAAHPDIQRRVQEEIDRVLEEDGGDLTYEGMQKMKYLDMAMSETLRLYPPAALTDRKCIKPYVLTDGKGGRSYKVSVGDAIGIPIYAIQRDPQFFPDPDKFDPERFSEENKHNIQPCTYLPFGSGPRNCIGMRFALMESKIAMISLLSRFNIEILAKTSLPIVLDRTNFGMIVQGGFWVGFKPRSSS